MNAFIINYIDRDCQHNELISLGLTENAAIFNKFRYEDLVAGLFCIESVEKIKKCECCKKILCDEEIEYYGDLCFLCGEIQELNKWS